MKEYEYKKRVTKNDRKSKNKIYSQKHIRIVLKHLEGKSSNVRESEKPYQQEICTPKIGRVVGTSK
tara:strand:+ start:482 stop:679 length:198 start_codon:yes stop_codon:yes gene_type:complete